MGSQTSPSAASLPDASSPDLVLVVPSPEERSRTWSLTHPMWGPALAHDDYVTREAYLTTVPLAKDGGITHWILTVSGLPPNERPILSSCESLLKHAIATHPPAAAEGRDDVEVVEGAAHGIASVFTDPQYRGRGYASRMMKELGPRLRNWQVRGKDDTSACAPAASDPGPSSLFSVLYSDIGKKFYAKNGWAPFPSAHASFTPVAAAAAVSEDPAGAALQAKPIGYHELAELSSVDEQLLRRAMAARARATGKTCAAILPDLDAMLWHLMREDFMTKHIFGKTPAVRGAVFGPPGRRLWSVWMRGYYGGLDKTEGNTFHILRFVVEDETVDAAYRVQGFRSIMRIAQAEAAEWRSHDVQMWNPTDAVKELIAASGLPHTFVDRDSDSIASLMWYGKDSQADLDWVLNEKYAWC